jgi:hypothetical protein
VGKDLDHLAKLPVDVICRFTPVDKYVSTVFYPHEKSWAAMRCALNFRQHYEADALGVASAYQLVDRSKCEGTCYEHCNDGHVLPDGLDRFPSRNVCGNH